MGEGEIFCLDKTLRTWTRQKRPGGGSSEAGSRTEQDAGTAGACRTCGPGGVTTGKGGLPGEQEHTDLLALRWNLGAGGKKHSTSRII